MTALERKNTEKHGKTQEKFLLKAKGMDSHGPQAALGMTESCHECR
jgi:hypothetical protein